MRKRERYATDARVKALEAEVANMRGALKAWEELFSTIRAGIADDEQRLTSIEQALIMLQPFKYEFKTPEEARAQ